jgi:D-alanyl-lipoteichoic acid acyltransferase DltB (MBOAT superfamily)
MTATEIAILVAVIVVYFGWALFNGFLAKLRNHSFAAWFGISLCIMPPFAMIALLVLCKPDNNHLIP